MIARRGLQRGHRTNPLPSLSPALSLFVYALRIRPNPNFQTSYSLLSHSSLSLSSRLRSATPLSSCMFSAFWSYMSSSSSSFSSSSSVVSCADNTSLAHTLAPVLNPRVRSSPLPSPLYVYRLKSPLSYYAVLYVQISRKLRRPCVSIAFFSISLARAAVAPPSCSLPETFSPSKDSW